MRSAEEDVMAATLLLFLAASFVVGVALIWVRDRLGGAWAISLSGLALLVSIVAAAFLFRSVAWSIATLYGTSCCLFVGTRIHELRRGRNILFD